MLVLLLALEVVVAGRGNNATPPVPAAIALSISVLSCTWRDPLVLGLGDFVIVYGRVLQPVGLL